MILIGIDPGLASMGLCAVHLGATEALDRLLAVKVLRTAPAPKKRSILATEDTVRRMGEIYAGMDAFFGSLLSHPGRPVAICTESQSWPRSASSSAKTGMAWGIIASWAAQLNLPIIQASPQAVKKAVTGKKTATKADVEAAVIARYPNHDDLRPRNKSVAGSPREHAADAVAVVVACLPHPTVQAVRRMMGHTYGGK